MSLTRVDLMSGQAWLSRWRLEPSRANAVAAVKRIRNVSVSRFIGLRGGQAGYLSSPLQRSLLVHGAVAARSARPARGRVAGRVAGGAGAAVHRTAGAARRAGGVALRAAGRAGG